MKSENIKTDVHWKTCPAPICTDEKCYKNTPNWKNELVFYAGEPICQLHDEPGWKKKQLYINRLFNKGNLSRLKEEGLLEVPLTISDLMKI